MKRQAGVKLMLVAGLVLLGALLHTALGVQDEDAKVPGSHAALQQPKATKVTYVPEQTATEASNKVAPPVSPHTQPPASSFQPTRASRVDPERVRAAIARAHRLASTVTREQIEAEQKRLTEARERLLHTSVAEPRIEPFKDERGVLWNRLIYPSGEVRYEFPAAE